MPFSLTLVIISGQNVKPEDVYFSGISGSFIFNPRLIFLRDCVTGKVWKTIVNKLGKGERLTWLEIQTIIEHPQHAGVAPHTVKWATRSIGDLKQLDEGLRHKLIGLIEKRYVPQLSPDDAKALYEEPHMKTYTEIIRDEAERKTKDAEKEIELLRLKLELAKLREQQALSSSADELAKSGVDRETVDLFIKTVAGKLRGSSGEGNENPSGASG